MEEERALIHALVLIVTAADAAADAIALHPGWSRRQWLWHLLKWLRFYPPLGACLHLVSSPWWEIVLLAGGCYVIWRAVYEFVLEWGKHV